MFGFGIVGKGCKKDLPDPLKRQDAHPPVIPGFQMMFSRKPDQSRVSGDLLGVQTPIGPWVS